MPSFALDLEPVSPGLAALTPAARYAGALVLDCVSRALAAEVGVPVHAHPRVLPGVPAAALGTEELTVDVGAVGAQVIAEVDATLGCAVASLLVGAPAQVAPARALLPAERAALELLALVALRGLHADERWAPLATRLVREQRPSRDVLAVDLAVELGDATGEVRLRVPRAVLARLDVLANRAAPRALPEVSIGARWRRGTLTLSREELESIRPGDVAVLDAGTGQGDALLFDGGVTLIGRADGNTFKVEERTMQEWNGHFPVALSVEVARVTVSLRDLADVEPGSVIPLNVARDGRVTLRSGDVVVAHGELVDVDGALGVRISDWQVSR